MSFFKQLYFTRLFFGVGIALVFLFIISFMFPPMHRLGLACVLLLLIFIFIDIFLLFFTKKNITASRQTPEKLSNSDYNEILLHIRSTYNFNAEVKVIDEIPHQFQKRNFELNTTLKPFEPTTIGYQLRPTKRGEYHFGNINIYIEGIIGLVIRKFEIEQSKTTPVYPSYIQMKKYELMAFSPNLLQFGIKKVRRIGTSLEFEKIKEYVLGDDSRQVNWKATARKATLMVNQMQDEKSQPIYCVIDKGRQMKMPFNELSLLDYSINSALAISNIALKKGDKAGLITFHNTASTIVKASSQNGQLHRINEALYSQRTEWLDCSFEKLYVLVKKYVTQRSLLLLFTNFESLSGMNRVLPQITLLNKNHLVVCVVFQNTEFQTFLHAPIKSKRDAYYKAVAEKMDYEKRQIVRELQRHSIQTIYTTPQNLSIETINKYLELKARGKI